MADGGLTSIELTMTTPGAIRMLEKAAVELPNFIFGLGTVLDAETARMGILAGAWFVVTWPSGPRSSTPPPSDFYAPTDREFLERPVKWARTR